MSIHTHTDATTDGDAAANGETDNLADNASEEAIEPFQNPDETPDNEAIETEGEEFSPALLFAEDFVLTAVLSAGKPLRAVDLGSRATDWVLPKRALSAALQNAKTLVENDRAWDARWRATSRGLSREERLRQPLETALRELLLAVGKPLPTPVLARELDLIRNVPDPNLKTAVANVLKTARWALEVAPGVWLHQDFVFKTGAPTEALLIKENDLGNDPDFQGLISFAEITATDMAGIARELMEFTGGPLNQKVIGFFVHRADPKGFSPLALASVLNDRAQFQPLIGGFVALQEQLGALKELTQEYLEELETPVEAAELQALVEQSVAQTQNPTEAQTPGDILVLDEVELGELKRLAQNGETEIFNVAQGVLALHDYEADDPRLLHLMGAAIEALNGDRATWIPIPGFPGQFYLRERLPEGIGAPPAILWPYHALFPNPQSGLPFDFELEDDALDAPSRAFIHDPFWEDVGEEDEVVGAQPNDSATKVVVLNHHRRAGTVKMRRADEGIFAFEGPFAPVQIVDASEGETFEVWASRETGLLNGLAQWCEEHLPPSGGTVCFEKQENGVQISFEPPHAATFLTERRADELEELRERAEHLSVFEIVTELLGATKGGLEIVALWAQVNAVRRTSKRLLASVLNGYGCFQSVQKGEKWVWQLNSSKGAESFKEELRGKIRA